MGKLISYAAAFMVLLTCGCKETGSNDAEIRRMEDTLFKLYPTVNGVSVEVRENADVFITLRDKELYGTTAAEQQKITDNIAAITVSLFEKNNYLDEGTVIFVKEENTLDVKEEDKKKYDMQLKKLLSAGK